LNRPAKRILSVVVGLVAAFAVGEGICRVVGLDGRPDVDPAVLDRWRTAREESIHQASRDPLLRYVTRPNYIADGRRWTEAGGILRATDVPLSKPPDVVRIAVLGDSISAMHALRRHFGALPWPDLLEAQLNREERRSGRTVEVLNFATDGYGTLQEARLLETRVLPYDPDLVLLQYCFNDTATSFTPAIWFVAEDSPTSWLLSYLSSRLRRERVDEFDPRHSRYAADFGPTTPEGLAWWREMYDPESVGWRRVQSGFGRIATAAGSNSIPVVLVVFPLLIEASDRHPFVGEIHRRVVDLGRGNGFPVADLSAAFSEHAVRDLKERAGRDVYHPGILGHHVAARAIAGFLVESGLL